MHIPSLCAEVVLAATVLLLMARRRRARLGDAAVAKQPSAPVAGFHRRLLPPPSIATSSEDGRRLHKEAMSAGGMESYFRLAEAFHTQAEPAFCGLGTLVNVLNALEVDPGTVLMGTWRWYSESMLDCCVDLEEVKRRGLTFDEWGCVARCQGLAVEMARAADSSLTAFRAAVVRACTSTTHILCVAYSRKPLQQTGDGQCVPCPTRPRLPVHRGPSASTTASVPSP